MAVTFLFRYDGAVAFTHTRWPFHPRSQTQLSTLSSTSVEKGSDAVVSDSGSEDEESKRIRPLHQNWWPAATVDSLHEDRPNPLQVLGKSLVTYYGKNAEKWNVLDDLCSHRFAPLSEGRIVDCNKLQCAYHGWEYSSDGTCTNVPQQPNRVDKAKPVQSYAVREDLGIIWVWMDPESADSLADSIRLPIDQFLRNTYETLGPHSCFMRDLPYGMEILGENLLDLSHLPFAHHSVGQLDRSMGKELPTRMLSLEERKKNANWETAFGENPSMVLPRAQAEITQAAAHDPIFVGSYNPRTPEVFKNWTTTIGYYDPCHVRYQRYRGSTSTVELFMCPTSEGRSRVFLFNCFEGLISEPTSVKAKLTQKLLKKVFLSSKGHMMAHKIFDGDGIFLHKQGNRMKVADLTYKDYSTPASADVLLNQYRRFLDAAAKETRKVGLDSIADAAVGTKSYGDDAQRSELLDRYNTHTAKCSVCMKSLQKARRKKATIERLQTAFQGATGSGIAALGTLAALRRLSSVALPSVLFGYVAVASCAGFAGSFLSSAMKRRTEKTINGFLFEDYVHADKN